MFKKKKIHIYFKNGNILKLRNIESFKVVRNGLGETIEVSWQFTNKNTTILKLNIDSIDCIISKKQWF